MLRLSGLDNFYYLPMLHDMRYKGPRLSEIIRNIYHRDPLNGDIYIYMSRDRRTIRLFQYKHHVYDLHDVLSAMNIDLRKLYFEKEFLPIRWIGRP